MPELLQFRFSPYNEKVRWALDCKRVAHRRTSVLPGPHLAQVRRLTGRTQTPVLVLDDRRALDESARIVDWLDEHHPQPRLLPPDAAAAETARAIERRFDEDIAPRGRRAVLAVLLQTPRYFARVFGDGRSALAQALYAAVGKHAVRVITNAQPPRPALVLMARVDALLGVGPGGRRPQPHIEIQFRRHRHLRLRRQGGVPGSARDDALQFSNLAVAHQLRGMMAHAIGPELAVRAKHPLIRRDCLDDFAPFRDVAGERFFAGDIFPRPQRGETHHGVPMIRRGNHDRIIVLAREHLPEIFGREAVLVLVALVLGSGRMVNIGPLPVNIHGEVDYSVIHPDDKPGSRWDARIYITAVIPTFVF